MDDDYITAVEVCYMLNIATTTLNNWCKWYKLGEAECPELPLPVKIHGKNYWHRSDMGKLFEFKAWIPHGRNGKMGSVNRKYFGRKQK